MKSLISSKEAKQLVARYKAEGIDDIDVLTRMHIAYIKRLIGIKQLSVVAKELGWTLLPKTEKVTPDEIYEMGFRPPKYVAQKLGAEKKCCLTIAYGAAGPKEEPFEEMNE